MGVGALVGGVLIPAGSASARTDSSPMPSSAGIIHYATPNPRAVHIVLKGTKTAQGCKFNLRGTGSKAHRAAGQTVPQYHETAFNPNTCQSFIDEVQVIPSRRSTTARSGEKSVGAGHRSGGKVAASPRLSPAVAHCDNPFRDPNTGAYSNDACIHSWFVDPVGIHVNDVMNEVQWNPQFGCAAYGPWYSSWHATWLSADGWFQNFNNFIFSGDCNGVTSALLDGNISGNFGIEFENDVFCGLNETTTWYAPQLTGHADGSYSWNVGWEKVGLCEGLLSFQLQDES
jgi:hypothetical protein